jgi:hypothetical protein
MIMIVHEAAGMAKPVEPLDDGAKHKEKILSVLVAQKYFVPSIPSGGDMIDGIWIFNS